MATPTDHRFWKSATRRRMLLSLTVVLVGIAFYFLLYRSEQVKSAVDSLLSSLAPILMGLALAYLLSPLQNRLRGWLFALFGKKAEGKHRRRAEVLAKGFSIGISVLLVAALIVLLLVLILPEIGRSIASAAKVLPSQVQNAITWVNNHLEGDSQWALYLQQIIQKGFAMLQDWAATALPKLAESLLTYVTSGVIGVFKGVFNVVIALIVAIYVLKDKHLFLGQAKKLLCAVVNEKQANSVLKTARHAHKIVGGYLIGMLIESAIVGVITFAALSLMRMPYALLVSVIVGVTNIIPVFGPIIGAIPSALLILLSDPKKGIVFIIFIILLQQIEGNIIAPRVLGDSTGVSPFWVTFSLLLFGSLFGFIGMLIGVPLFAVLYYLASLWVNERLATRKLPTATDAYTEATGLQDGVLTRNEPLPPVKERKTKE